jgi:hypothetical protein
MTHSGACLCGQTKITVSVGTFNEQVNKLPLFRILGGANHDIKTRLCATVLIVGKRVEVLSAPTFSCLRRTLLSQDLSKSTVRKRPVVTRVIYKLCRNVAALLILLTPSITAVARIFCGNCGAAVSHKSPAFGEAQAVQTGLFSDFSRVPIKTERTWLLFGEVIRWLTVAWIYSIRQGSLEQFGGHRWSYSSAGYACRSLNLEKRTVFIIRTVTGGAIEDVKINDSEKFGFSTSV